MLSEGANKGIIFHLDTVETVKIKKGDTSSLLAGIRPVREKGYFSIYKFDMHDAFVSIFDSSGDQYCLTGIPVSNKSIDCVCYDPFMLHFENADFNLDGLNDLIFRGRVLYFCKGRESGYGRMDRKPLKSVNIEIKYKAEQKSNSIFYKIIGTEICEDLKTANL